MVFPLTLHVFFASWDFDLFSHMLAMFVITPLSLCNRRASNLDCIPNSLLPFTVTKKRDTLVEQSYFFNKNGHITLR